MKEYAQLQGYWIQTQSTISDVPVINYRGLSINREQNVCTGTSPCTQPHLAWRRRSSKLSDQAIGRHLQDVLSIVVR